MTSATIIRVWQDGANAFVAARVAEGGAQGNVEYIASVPLSDFNALGTAAEKKEALRLALKAKRDAAAAGPADIAGITGSITI